jgi:hypothetical protein
MHTALVYTVSNLLHIGETEDTATWTCYIHDQQNSPQNYATSRKVTSSIPDEVTGFFN